MGTRNLDLLKIHLHIADIAATYIHLTSIVHDFNIFQYFFNSHPYHPIENQRISWRPGMEGLGTELRGSVPGADFPQSSHVRDTRGSTPGR